MVTGRSLQRGISPYIEVGYISITQSVAPFCNWFKAFRVYLKTVIHCGDGRSAVEVYMSVLWTSPSSSLSVAAAAADVLKLGTISVHNQLIYCCTSK